MASSAPVSAAALDRIQKKSLEAERLTELLRAQINSLQQTAVAKACKAQEEKLRAENAVLRGEVEKLLSRLMELEVRHGVKQVAMPKSGASVNSAASTTASATSSTTAAVKPASNVDKENLSTENVKKATTPAVAKVTGEPAEPKKPEQEGKKQPAAAEGGKKQPVAAEGGKKQPAATATTGGAAAAAAGGDRVDVSRLNMRIGFIISAKRHPDADALYVEEVDVGEEKPRTIVSGLVKHVPLEQMQQRYAVFLLNLKAAKMRGVLSEGMIMCASTPDKVEIIQPPEGVTVGQRVVVDDYPGPADDHLNPKKKIWEQIQPDLRINHEGVATYRGSLWRIEGQPATSFKAVSLTDCPIK